jgi:ElaB/YqjD/DUF883 family membrane-anchored ribosome-binding protein
MADTNYGAQENETNQLADQMSNVAQRTKETMSDTAKSLKDKTQELSRNATDKLEETRASAAGALHSTASSLHENAAKLPNVPDLAHSAAERLEAVATYLDGHDTKQMMADVESLVRRNPGPSLLVAGALGFILARAFRNDYR